MTGNELRDLGMYEVFDTRVELAVSGPLVEPLAAALGDLRVPTCGSATHSIEVRLDDDGEWVLTAGESPRYRGPEIDLAFYDTLIAFNELAARRAVLAGRVVLHGGAVAVAGSGVAFVGHSGAGKSTLTAAMALAGHHFLADEVVAVDGEGVIHPFHRPVGLRQGGIDALGVAMPDGPFGFSAPLRVGGRGTLGGPTPITLVILLRRSDDGPARFEPLSPPHALLQLANQTLGGELLEREMFHRLDAFVRSVPVTSLHYGHVADAVVAIETCIGDAP
jgi:hypothetical protein